MLKTERMDRVRAALRAQGLTQMIVCDPKRVVSDRRRRGAL